MHWMTLIGTIAIGAVLIIALVAVFDILFVKPSSSRAKKTRSTDEMVGTDASALKREPSANVRRRRRLAEKKN